MPRDLAVIDGDAIDRIQRGASVPVIVVFAAPWSDACRRQLETLRHLRRQHTTRVEIYVVDIDDSRQVAGRLNIHSIPTLIVFHGGVEKARWIGLQPVSALNQVLRATPLGAPVPSGSDPAPQDRQTGSDHFRNTRDGNRGGLKGSKRCASFDRARLPV